MIQAKFVQNVNDEVSMNDTKCVVLYLSHSVK